MLQIKLNISEQICGQQDCFHDGKVGFVHLFYWIFQSGHASGLQDQRNILNIILENLADKQNQGKKVVW